MRVGDLVRRIYPSTGAFFPGPAMGEIVTITAISKNGEWVEIKEYGQGQYFPFVSISFEPVDLLEYEVI